MTKQENAGKNKTNLKLVTVGVLSLAVGVLGTLGISSAVNGGSGGEKVPEGVVATLDGDTITSNELYNAMVEGTGEATLSTLFADKVTALEAKANKVKITDEEIQKEIDGIVGQYGTEDDFKAVLKESGQTMDDLREDVTAYLQLVELLSKKIDTSDEALKAEFEANKATYGQAEKVSASHILVADEATSKKLHAELKAGADFNELAKANSMDYNTEDDKNGASLGYFGRDEMVEEFEAVVFKMKVGDISEPFKTEYGWHIAKVEDKVEEKEASFETSKDAIKESLVQVGMNDAYTSWIKEMEEKYKYKSKLVPTDTEDKK